MAIDFTLSPEQRAFQLQCRHFARDVLGGVRSATQGLTTPAERFAATRPMYEAVVR